MNPGPLEIYVALAMVAIASVLVVFFMRHMVSTSTRRTEMMLRRVGVDADVASCAEHRPAMRDARRRCHSCAAEDYCDRWLVGEVGGDDAFCPNARVFHRLAEPVTRSAV